MFFALVVNRLLNCCHRNGMNKISPTFISSSPITAVQRYFTSSTSKILTSIYSKPTPKNSARTLSVDSLTVDKSTVLLIGNTLKKLMSFSQKIGFKDFGKHFAVIAMLWEISKGKPLCHPFRISRYGRTHSLFRELIYCRWCTLQAQHVVTSANFFNPETQLCNPVSLLYNLEIRAWEIENQLWHWLLNY